MRQLVSDLGAEVLVVDKLTYAGSLASLASVAQSPNFRFLRADICNPAAMAQAITDFRPDAIMHLAAESHVDRSIDGPATFIETNIVGTFGLLEAATAYWRDLSKAQQSDLKSTRLNSSH